MGKHTYTIKVVRGWSKFDHLSPIGVEGKVFNSLAEARRAIARGQDLQGDCAIFSRQVRVDIVRSDGRRFEWGWTARRAGR